MSLLPLTAQDRRVVADRRGRPTSIRAGRQHLVITAVEVVREEVAAYPVQEGPRTLFIIRAGDRRFRIVHLHRERRWLVEALAADPVRALAPAA